MGGLQAWLNSNYDGGTSGVAGDLGTTARTNGTNRTFTEDILKVVVKEVYASGGNPKVLMVNPAHKQLVSAFTGIAAQRFMAPANTPTTIVSAADVIRGVGVAAAEVQSKIPFISQLFDPSNIPVVGASGVGIAGAGLGA